MQTQYPDLDLTVQEDFPYLLAVNREAGVVTVYASDNDPENPRYTVPYLAMVCSGGPDTPTGVYNTPVSYDWRLLSGPCYGQYAPASGTPTCSTACPTTPSTRTTWSMWSSTSWAPRPRWAASG